MNKLLARIHCWLFGHDLYLQQVFQPTGTKRECCDHCGGDWITTTMGLTIGWSDQAGEMYAAFGNRILPREPPK